MATYARVVGGRVMEVFTPPTGLTLANCFAPAIAAQFVGVPHDSPVPSDGWTYDGTTFAEPVAPTLTLVQQAAAAFAAGFHIVSTATPAVSGTYPLDPAAQVKIIALSTYIAINGMFPGGVTTYVRFDTAGAEHVFPSVTVFQEWATKVADYVAALDLIIDTGAGSLPAQPAAMT